MPTIDLPTVLARTSVKILDSKGTKSLTPLLFMSPGQINYVLPAQVAEGLATVTITNQEGFVTRGFLNVVNIAPGLFSADATGTGWAAANVVYARGDGSQEWTQVARFDETTGKMIAIPIDVNTLPAYLVLYGTGFRQQGGLANVKVRVDGIDIAAEYAGAQGFFVGLD